jgi:hypothetical protein
MTDSERVFYDNDSQAYSLEDVLMERVSLRQMLWVWLLKILKGAL